MNFSSLLMSQSLSSLKADGQKVNEHNAVTPDMMSRLMKDLESPEANPKAAELFAKRKAMAQGKDRFHSPSLSLCSANNFITLSDVFLL